MASRGENEGFVALDEFVAEALPGRAGSRPNQAHRAVNEGMSTPEDLVIDLGSPTEATAETVRRIEAAIGGLPAPARESYLLRLGGVPLTEIAARLGVSEPTVEQLLAQARVLLGEQLNGK